MSTPDADEQLRQTVSELAAREDCAWAGIYFVEEDELVLGPEAGDAGSGTAHDRPRASGATRASPSSRPTARSSAAELEAVAAGIADLCLVGWDTGGEPGRADDRPSFEGESAASALALSLERGNPRLVSLDPSNEGSATRASRGGRRRRRRRCGAR